MEMSWIISISQLYSQIINLFENAILKLIHIRLFDLLTRCHYILNPSRKFREDYPYIDKDIDIEILFFVE